MLHTCNFLDKRMKRWYTSDYCVSSNKDSQSGVLRAVQKNTKSQFSALVKSMSTSDDDMIPMKEFKHIEVPIIKIVTNDSSNDISNIPIITLTEPEPDDYGKFRFSERDHSLKKSAIFHDF